MLNNVKIFSWFSRENLSLFPSVNVTFISWFLLERTVYIMPDQGSFHDDLYKFLVVTLDTKLCARK